MADRANPPKPWSLDVRHRVETPEQVEIDFELAGPGSRFCALVLDLLLMWLVVFLLAIIATATGLATLRDLTEGPSGAGSWVIAVIWIVVMFLLTSGYYILFEILMRGQTPGKRAMHLRVVREDGLSITVTDSLIRNLLRIVDFLPAAYGLGGAICMFHPAHKRLGDIAAGTLVVKEARTDFRAHTDKRYDVRDTPIPSQNRELSPDERRLVAGFLTRRSELLPDARSALARRMADSLHARHGGDASDPEWYLECLYEGRHHGQ